MKQWKHRGGGEGAAVVSEVMPPQNPIEQLQSRFKELESGFKAWLSKQSLPVEAAVVTTTSAAQGAAIGALMGTLTNDVSSLTPPPQANVNPQAMASLKQAQVRFWFSVRWKQRDLLSKFDIFMARDCFDCS